MCKCGHGKSQHQENEKGIKVCDYKGYACDCEKFEKQIKIKE